MKKVLLFITLFIVFSIAVKAQIATYTGSGGTSTTCVAVAPNCTVSSLGDVGFGTNTACSSGGLSGITVSTAWSSYSSSGPHVYFQIWPNAGYTLSITNYWAVTRESNTGPTLARLAYSLDGGATWIDEGMDHAQSVCSCCGSYLNYMYWGGTSGPVLSGITSTNGIIVAIYPYAPTGSSGTFQVQYMEVDGTVDLASTAPTITTNPSNVTICSGSNTSFTSTASGAPTPTYQWQRSTTGTGGPWTNIITGMDGGIYGASFTSSTLTITGATLTENGYAYRMVATNSAGSATSTAALLTVLAAPTVAAISGTLTLCSTGTTALTDATSGGAWSSTNTGVATVGTTGTVSGVSAGTSTISYTVTNTCGTTAATAIVTVSAPVAAITGSTSVCVGSTTLLSNTTAGGTWTSSNPSIATVGSTTGIVTGVAAGTVTITYSVTNACGTTTSTTTVTVSATAAALTGTASLCVGATTTLSSTTTGGTWSSSNAGVATVGSTTGLVTGVAAGTATITYSVTNACGTTTATAVVTVNAAAAAIGGTTTICSGSTTTLTNTTTGGTWTSGTTSVATIGSTTGVVTGIAQGTTVITYTVISACGTTTATVNLNVNVPAALITGTTGLCVGATSSLSNTTTGGTWSSSNSGVASVGSTTGVVTGVAAGTATITYSVTNACGTTTATTVVTVNAAAAAIGGTTTICSGTTTTLTNATTGGTWTSGTTSVATIGSTTGVVTGIAQGTSVVTYTVISACGTTTATVNLTVNAPASVIGGTTSICTGSTSTLTNTTTGGSWSSSNAGIASVGATTGVLTGVANGTCTITYSVTNACGTTTATVGVTVYTGAGLISGTSTICAGNSVTLTNTTAGGFWSSSNLTVATVGSTTGILTGVHQGTATITYSVTNPCGTTTATLNVTVNQPAAPFFAPDTLCTSAFITLTDSVPGGTWSVSNTHASIGSTTGVLTGITQGTVIVSYSLTNACGPTLVTRSVYIMTAPTISPISGSNSICAGLSTVLTDATAGGTWSCSNTLASITGMGVVNTVAPGTDTVLYTLSNSCGLTSVRFIINISNSVVPAVSITAAPGLALCPGINVTLTATPTNGGSFPIYVWSVNGAIVGGGSTYTYMPSNGDVIKCELHSNATCAVPDSAGQFVTMSVSAPVVPSISFTSTGGDTLCQGILNTFTAVPVNGGTTPGIQWSVNWINVGTGNTFSYIPTNGDIVSCMLTSSAACVYPDTASFRKILVVEPWKTPSLSIIAEPGDAICEGNKATIVVLPVNGGWGPHFYWTKNGTYLNNTMSYTYLPTVGDSIVVMMVSNYHCPMPSDTAIAGLKLQVDPLIEVTITGHPGMLVTRGAWDTLHADAINAGLDPTYQWYVNSVIVPGATNVNFISRDLQNKDSVSCIVKTGSGTPCEGIKGYNWMIMVVAPLEVGNSSKTFADMYLAPNPNAGGFVIEGNILSSEKVAEIEVNDVIGKIIYKHTIQIKDNFIKQNIQLGSNIANGVYILRINAGEESYISKFTINR